MTQQTLTTSFLKHSQPLLTKCLQAALIAAPVMLAAAPSHAAVVTSSVQGFTGLFAKTNWALASGIPNTGTPLNSVAFNATTPATTLTIVKNNANSSSVNAIRVIDTALVDALRPIQGFDFVGFKVFGKFTFTGSNLARLDFSGQSNSDLQLLETAPPNPGTPVPTFTAFSFTGDGNLDDVVKFDISRLSTGIGTTVGTGVISDFKFEAYYDVPGPLPIVGAAAAFAWSRKLRNRLKPANTLV
jgi:hypothetical protein